jgi:FKBP-type peptidyl-prolyl cis-trans isomerase 2
LERTQEEGDEGMTQVEEGVEVSASYTMSDENGNLIASSETDGPMVFVIGKGAVLPAIEEAVIGRKAGDRLEFEVPPERAFGLHRPELVFESPRANLPPGVDVQPGAQLFSGMGDRPKFSLRVVKETENGVLLDGNHPLAGRTLRISLHVTGVRRPAAMETMLNQQLDLRCGERK